MKLYDARRTPNGRRVHVFLAEKGLSLPISIIDYDKRGYNDPDYVRLNPFRQLPLLITDEGEAISESLTICRYLEMIHPRPNLFGQEKSEIIQVDMWQRRAELSFFYPVAQAFRHTHPYMKNHEIPQVSDWGESCKTKALSFMPTFDQHLEGREFLAIDRYSVADITLMIAMEFLKPAGIDFSDDYVNLKAWFERVKARPSSSATF